MCSCPDQNKKKGMKYIRVEFLPLHVHYIMKKKKTKLERERGIVERKKTVGHDPITGKAIRKSFYGSGRHALEQIDEKYHAYMSRGAEVSESSETLAAVCER